MSKWIIKGYDPVTNEYWTIAEFNSKFKAKHYIRRDPSLHKGNLHKGDK